MKTVITSLALALSLTSCHSNRHTVLVNTSEGIASIAYTDDSVNSGDSVWCFAACGSLIVTKELPKNVGNAVLTTIR